VKLPIHAHFGFARWLALAAIGSVVIALALPLLSVQRELARRAQCANNMRAISAAMYLYATDYNGWFPALSRLNADGTRGIDEKGFDRHVAMLLNQGYTHDPSIFVCPSAREDGDPFRPLSNDGFTGHARVRPARGGPPWIPGGSPRSNVQWFNISYVYVAGLTTRDRPEFLVLADEHHDSEGDCPAECRHDLDQFDNHGAAGRNALFVDGHVEWVSGVSLDKAYEPIKSYGANIRTRTVD
jgi:prepilin-type processing-associated H-X9-DG protein